MIRFDRIARALALALLAAWAVLAPVHPAADDGFVQGVEDLPLMAGLQPVPEANLVFDSPAGRIVVAFAAGAVSRAEVLRFYGDTLPQLGWKPDDVSDASAVFRREGEELRLALVEAEGGPLTVQFTLAPTGRE